MAVDAVWRELKAVSAALRSAKNKTERGNAVAQAQQFLSDDHHRRLVHKWRAWGLLLSNLLHVVKTDAQAYLHGPSTTSTATNARSRKRGALTSSPPADARRRRKNNAPRLEFWAYLRNEFASLHALDDPVLHLDPNGRECVHQLFEFAVVVIGREADDDEDATIAARLEDEAWRTIELIVPLRVYCTVVPAAHLQDVLELALASLEHGNTLGLTSRAALRASVVHKLLPHCPFDLQDLLPRLLEFFSDWFSRIGIGSASGFVSAQSVDDVAPLLLAAVTDLVKAQATEAGLSLLTHGVPILHYIQRVWKATKFRPRGHMTEFIQTFLDKLGRYAPEILLRGTAQSPVIVLSDRVQLDATLLRRTLKALVAMLLSPKDVQSLLLNAKVSGSASGSGVLGSGSSGTSSSSSAASANVGAILDAEPPIASYVRCAADVIFHHDRLVATLLEHESVSAEPSDSAAVGSKRARPVSTTLAWESLLETLVLSDAPLDGRTGVQKQHVAWLLVLLAVLTRHGAHYVVNRIGDVMTAVDALSHVLEAKELEQRQYVALSVLVQLSHLAAQHSDACSDLLDDRWQRVYRQLLRIDLPYADATESAVLSKDAAGAVVLRLLTNAIAFRLVPQWLVAETHAQVVQLSVFQNARATLVAASRAASGSHSSASAAPVRLLTALLQCVELHERSSDSASSELVLSQPPPGREDGDPRSLRTKLLAALFTHLEMQATAAPSSFPAIAYATGVLAFVAPARTPHAFYSGSRLVSSLLHSVAQRAESVLPANRALDGFGVHFTCHEDGLATLFQASDADASGPHRFAEAIETYLSESALTSPFHSKAPPSASASRREPFKPLTLPTELLAPLLPGSSASAFDFAVPLSHQSLEDAPLIASDAQIAMHKAVATHFASLLTSFSATLRSVSSNARMLMQSLGSVLQVATVLACLYTELPRPAPASGDARNSLDVAHLLERVLALVADHIAASAFAAAQTDSVTATCVINVLARFHSFVLILQGKRALAACAHPSAEPMDLRFPPELRQSIRKIVGAIEAGLMLVGTGDSSSSSCASQALSASEFVGSSSSTDWVVSTSSSSQMHAPMPPAHSEVLFRDALDDSSAHDRSSAARPRTHVLKTISLWCFRVLLLLKKESGLKTISDVAQDVQFPPDFLLALATLLCGVAGTDSLDLLLKLLDYAAEEASRGASRQSNASVRLALFQSQVFGVLKLAGRMHERRKHQLNDDVPDALMQYTQAFAAASRDSRVATALHVLRRAELECLEVFFRLDLDAFAVYVDRAMARMLDDDWRVRHAAVRGIHSLFYMYPDGGQQVFKDLYHHLRPILPATCAPSQSDETQAVQPREPKDDKDPKDTGSIEICATVALALYECACSSEAVVPNVLVVFLRLASSDTPLYASRASTFLHAWLRAIATAFAYATLQRLLDDHFCYVWSEFIAMRVRSSSDEDDESDACPSRGRARELLEQFPIALFTGATTDSSSRRLAPSVATVFVDKVDILLPVGVLYDALDESTAPDAFPFLYELVAVLTPVALPTTSESDTEDETKREEDEKCARRLDMAVTEQLTTDLFALSFVLQASRDASLQDIASRMLAVAEAKAATSALSIAHLGHVVSKIARFTVWDLARVSDEPSDAARWLDAIAHMKHKYSGFDWTRMHVGELLCEFDALLLATERSGALAARAVHCFDQFVTEVASALASNFVLQQLVLRIAFSAIKQLAHHGSAIARRLTLCVRQACAQFMDTPDLFGKYVSFVVHEIADILARSRSEHSSSDSTAALVLDEDDEGHLEWVVFAVCNNMANGLGKSILDIDAVPVGVSSSLDKLSALIAGSRDVAASDGSTSTSSSLKKPSAVLSTGAASVRRASRQIDVFVKRAQDVGGKFYHQSRLIQSASSSSGSASKAVAMRSCSQLADRSASPSAKPLSTSLLRLATVEASVGALDDALDDTEQRERAAHVIGTLTKTLFYLSAREPPSSSRGHESDVLEALANALSAVGALDPHSVDLSPGADAASLSRLYHEQFHRGALRETKTSFLTTMYERVLVYLASLLFDDRALAPETVEHAVVALKRVLSLDEGKNALAKCKDSDLREFLSPFVSSPPANWSASVLFSDARSAGSRRAITTQQQHAHLWRSGNALGYDAWVRSMTSYLAAQARDPVLRACASLVAVRTEMAVFLFPYVLWSVLQPVKSSDSDVSSSTATVRPVAAVVETGVRDILKHAARSNANSVLDSVETDTQDDSETSLEPLEIVQLLVHSVTFLREIEKAAFVESNGKDLASASAPSESTPTGRASAPSSQSQPLNQRAYGCGINVDLLDVALAAIRVKMPYSAMQYVEMWLEETHGGSLPSLAASSSTTTAARAHVSDLDEYARQILVRAYSFDNNVDEIYGINDGRSLASQLVTYDQEGSYLKALPIYDVSLQAHVVQSRVSSSSRTQLLEGMLHSLRHLGFQHLLQGYLASLAPHTSASVELDEHKYELAWKNLQWGTPWTALSTASHERLDARPYCHQKVLFQSLKALAHRDSEHLAALLRTSKGAILTSVQLSLRGLESTRDAHTALLWLESIRDIEEAARTVGANTRSSRDAVEPDASAIALPRALDNTDDATSVTALCEQWQRRYARIAHDFDAIDSLVALQQVLVTLTNAPQTHALLARMHLAHAAFSRKANRVAVAYSALAKLEALDQQGHLAALESAKWKMERAKLLWTQHETRSAIWTAKLLCSELEQTLGGATTGDHASLELLHVAVLTTTGKWIASQRSENSQVILEAYFQRATDLVDAMDAEAIAQRVGDAAKAHLALADYMADMYHQVHTRVTSREWLAGKRVAEARHRELDECNAMPEDKRLANRAHIHALKKEVMFDNEERAKVEDSVAQFLTGALRSFGKGLALSPNAELAVVFRLLSLWFSNQRTSETNAAIDDVIDAVPSYKFVPLSYQIMSRIGSSSSSTGHRSARHGFQQVLRKLVLKLCLQHPHHALVQLLALKNNGDVEGKGAAEFRANVGDAKSDVAKSFMDELRASEQRALLESLDILSTAYIQLALFDTREYHNKGSGSGKKIALSKVPIVGLHAATSGSHSHQAISFDHCLRDRTRRGSANRAVMPAVLTCHVAPRADLDYSSVVRVLSFEPLFSITDSGIHRPKIIYCYGSNGRRFKQLVKGKDDTRQDLVIEQAFETVNHFLQHDAATRHLRLRTYKVVPLSPIAGVLEWVDSTVPWGSYLVGRTAKRLSAHERYHPHEWKHVDCRTKLKNATDKRAAYAAIEAHFTPVFHHFFLEKFPDPAMWYRRRLAYVQSAAVTSIVGYILGIGDRHSQNILVHEETAELVHIDFGVVFDQGMALFTPETVPFRLTRDMVDGMGVAGVDGVFTRCCEATLQLLRKKRASVVTILEVFVHDPLYRWTLSPLKALKIQEERGMGHGHGHGATTGATTGTGTASGGLGRRGQHSARSSSRDSVIVIASSDSLTHDATATTSATGDASASSNNDAAARALLRVKQKLDGYEDPNGNALSIEGQVKQLISAAQDPHNLCNLFPGWAPWL